MKVAPDTLYLSENIYGTYMYRVPDDNTDEYINKKALIKELEKRKEIALTENDQFCDGIATGFGSVIDLLNSM